VPSFAESFFLVVLIVMILLANRLPNLGDRLGRLLARYRRR